MKKNVAGQTIGVQMLATDGSAFTGAVTAFVTGDNGAQAQGSVGSGACTHKGNGFHTYAPAQAETNFDHIGFTFTGSGAAPATVQAYTTFPQAGDAFARLGAPAGASVSADVAAVKAVLPAALVGGRIDASVGAMAANTLTAAALAADAVTEIQSGLATAAAVAAVAAKTDNLPADPADQSLIIDATTAIMSRLGVPAGASVSADVAALPSVVQIQSGLATAATLAAVKAKTDALPAAPAATGDIPTSAVVAAAVWNEAVDGTRTARQSMRVQNSAAAGKASGLATTTARYRDLADTKDRIIATVDADGNRTAIALDVT